MTITPYDQPVARQFINTYAPVNIDRLFQVTAQQQARLDQERQQIGEQLKQYGSFKAPSAIDTQNYYDLTLGRSDIKDMIQKAATDSDWLKDAANRNAFLGQLNNVDYQTLANIRESAENQKILQTNIDKLKAEGRFNLNWLIDDKGRQIDLANWDTKTNGVLTTTSATPYATLGDISNPYFEGLRPSDIGTVWKNGMLYDRKAITQELLQEMANDKFSDLISTPQGQMHMRTLLQQYGGDEEKARQAFVQGVAVSQAKRVVNQDELNDYWVKSQIEGMQARAKAAAAGAKGTQVNLLPTRTDWTKASSYDSMKSSLLNDSKDFTSNWLKETDDLLKMYPVDSKDPTKAGIGKMLLAGKNKHLNAVREELKAQEIRDTAYEQFQLKQDKQSYETLMLADQNFQQKQNTVLRRTQAPIMEYHFQKAAGFSPRQANIVEHDPRRFRDGVKNALESVSTTEKLSDEKKDPYIFGSERVIETKSGDSKSSEKVYDYADSGVFLMPETVFSLMTNKGNARKAAKRDDTFSDNADWTNSKGQDFRTLVESGQFQTVHFVPASTKNMVYIAAKNGSKTLALKGKLRVPASQVADKLPYGWGLNIANSTDLFGSETTNKALGRNYGASKVKIGDEDYYEVDSYQAIPDVSSVTHRINVQSSRQPEYGGSEMAASAEEVSAMENATR